MRDDVGLDVAVILRRRRIDLHYSEFGMGGGASPIGTVPARSPEQAARMPFYGVWGAYRGGTDPWATSLVWMEALVAVVSCTWHLRHIVLRVETCPKHLPKQASAQHFAYTDNQVT